MSGTGTSVFDPALCEINYMWFSNKGDSILDPFAGGSVRGIVAVEMGRQYTGIDLRLEQVEANYDNATICSGDIPKWICGDSVNIKDLADGEYDFLFSCPPYGNLEKYSEAENDLSNMADEEFDETYAEIIRNSVAMLKEDRFACFVVGNYRDKKGYLRDLVGLTVRAFEDAGAHYYNDFVFITPCGSLPIRAGKQFSATRKAGKTHQYVLCFVKGDAKRAAARLDKIEIPDLSEYEEDSMEKENTASV